MASETVVSAQTPTVEEVKEKLNEEVQPTKQESDSPPRESGKQNPKAEESPSVESSLAKTEEKMDKLIEEPAASVTTLSETEEKTDDKPTVAPVIEEVVTTEDIPVVDIPVEENSEVAQHPLHEPVTSSVPKVVVDGVKSHPEEQPANETEPQEQPSIVSTDSKQEEQPATEFVNKEPETDSITKHSDEQPNIVGVPTSSVEVFEKSEEPLKVIPFEEPEAVTVTEREVSEVESIKEEKPESIVPEVEEKPEPTTVPGVEEKPGSAVLKVEEKTEPAVAEVGEKPEPIVPEVEEKSDSVVLKVEEKIEPAVAGVEEKPEAVVPEVEEKSDSAVPKVEENPEPAIAEVEEKPELVVPEVEEKSDSAVPKVEEKPEPAVTEVEEKPELVVPEVEKISEPTVPKVEEKPEPAVDEVEEKPEATVPEGKEKPGEQPIAEEIDKCENIEPNGSLPCETEKEEVAFPDKIEDITILKEENISKDREVLASKSADQVVSTNKEAHADSESDEGNPTPSVVEKVGAVNIEKEVSGSNVIEELSKEAVEELAKVEPIKVEDVNSAVSTAEVTTTPVEGESKSRDVELLAEPKESELEVKVDKLEKEEVDETVKSDVLTMEPTSKIGDDTKTSEDIPIEVPAKPTRKQSNNILTKVKKSIVKAKKAILGKSPNSKTIITEAKGDIEVK